MKSEVTRLLAFAVIVGASACKEPVYHAAQPEPPLETVAEPVVSEPIPSAAPAAPELSPRDKILAIRAENLGRTYQALEINGTPYGDGEVVSIDDNGVRLKLRAGFNDFAWADLPDNLKEIWGYDPNAFAPPITDVATAKSEEPVSKALDPQTQARVRAYEAQIAKLTEKIQLASTTVQEAEAFHAELSAVYAEEDKEAAKLKAARVYSRMRRSSCSS
jgi:hypothetical protein